MLDFVVAVGSVKFTLCVITVSFSTRLSLMYMALKPPYFTVPPLFYSRSGSQIAARGGENR